MLINLSVTAGGASISASAIRTSVFVGEAVYLDALTPTGFSVTEEVKELDYLWNFDKPGATYSAPVPYSDANYHRAGRAVTYYTAAGTYNPSCTVRSAAASASDSVAVTVTDPDLHTWDRDIYVSFAGNTTGWPAEAGAVEHVTSAATWDALSLSAGGEDIRITFRDDEVYTYANASERYLGGAGSTYYITRDFAGTNPPKIEMNGTTGGGVFQIDRSSSKRIAVYGLEFDGFYDPTTGDAPQGGRVFFEGTLGSNGASVEISFVACKSVGGQFFEAGGTAVSTSHSTVGVIDCDVRDWHNYGFALFGAEHDSRFAGCYIAQSSLALVRDGKTGTFPEAADHGPIRMGNNVRGSLFNCKGYSTSGWSFTGIDRAMQPFWRFHPIDTTEDWELWVHDCDVHSGNGIGGSGGQVFEGSVIGRPGKAQVSGNRFICGRQMREVFSIQSGNTAVMNNVFYIPNLNHNNAATTIFRPADANNDPSVNDGPVYLGFNTVISDRQFGDFTSVLSTWTGGTITDEHNVYGALGHTNSGSFTDYSPLSRADNFKPVTASPAIGGVTTGFVPVRDFDGNLRAQTTNKGAHHDSVGSDAGVSAPSNSVAPTIAELSATFPGEYAVSNLGTWANSEPYWISFNWQMDGVDVAVGANTDYADLTTCDVSALDDSTGNLTCRITMTNLSGTSVTATSNTIAV